MDHQPVGPAAVRYAVRAKGPDPNLLPHVLIITEPEPGEKEYEVEHNEGCPVACSWHPTLYGHKWHDPFVSGEEVTYPYPDEGQYTCYVQYELDANGIDSLGVVSHRESDGEGGWRDVAPHADPNYVPATQFEPEWKRLRPGRYVIEGWFTPPGWAGSEPVDADGGLTIIEGTPA